MLAIGSAYMPALRIEGPLLCRIAAIFFFATDASPVPYTPAAGLIMLFRVTDAVTFFYFGRFTPSEYVSKGLRSDVKRYTR